jgi:hypothetical protein
MLQESLLKSENERQSLQSTLALVVEQQDSLQARHVQRFVDRTRHQSLRMTFGSLHANREQRHRLRDVFTNLNIRVCNYLYV